MIDLDIESSRQHEAAAPVGRVRQGKRTPVYSVGVVVGQGERGFTVDGADGVLDARRAASCLLEPVTGDVVACLHIASEEAWITAVLEREEGIESTLRCDGATRLVTGQTLTIESQAMQVQTEAFALTSARAEIAADHTQLVGSELRVIGAKTSLIGSLLSTVFERVTQFSNHYLRTTEGLDRVQATHIEQDAGQLLRLSGEHALINGEKLVKTRGGQIHFG